MKVVGTRGRLSEQQMNEQIEDVRQRSITPDTHKARVMSSNLEDFEQPLLLHGSREDILSRFSQEVIQEDGNYPFYVDSYTHPSLETSRVLHFGINTHREELIRELEEHNAALLQKLNEADEKCSNISGISNYQKFCPKYIDLTTQENFVIRSAINYIMNLEQNIVLVDIFPREFSKINTGIGTININSLDTHTVLLYKTTGNKILVIDPNNPMFSSHLSKYGDYKIETLCSTNAQYKIYTRPVNSETGFATDKFRDCIDIAVKLAFGLNSDVNTYESLSGLLIQSQVVKFVTNNVVIDGISVTNKPIRLKQASDFEKIITCNKKLEVYSTELKEKEEQALKIYQEAQAKIKEQYDFTVQSSQNNYEKGLIGLQNEYSEYSGEDIYD